VQTERLARANEECANDKGLDLSPKPVCLHIYIETSGAPATSLASPVGVERALVGAACERPHFKDAGKHYSLVLLPGEIADSECKPPASVA
jgi:hypothetical protein